MLRVAREGGGADFSAARNEVPILRDLITQYGYQNVYNADELGFCPSRAPSRTIGFGQFKGRKLSKDRITVLVSVSADGTPRIRPLVISCSVRRRSFDGNEGRELGFDYIAAPKAWMNHAFFAVVVSTGLYDRYDYETGYIIDTGQRVLSRSSRKPSAIPISTSQVSSPRLLYKLLTPVLSPL